ncbi:hypothetical protein ACN47E_007464 [Coniothyrium glycines]
MNHSHSKGVDEKDTRLIDSTASGLPPWEGGHSTRALASETVNAASCSLKQHDDESQSLSYVTEKRLTLSPSTLYSLLASHRPYHGWDKHQPRSGAEGGQDLRWFGVCGPMRAQASSVQSNKTVQERLHILGVGQRNRSI